MNEGYTKVFVSLVAVAPDTPFPRATLAKRVSTRERCVRGVQQRYSAAALNLL